MTIGVDLEMDVRAAAERLQKIGKGINERQILSVLGQRFLTWINLNFRTGGIEERWPPLSPNTIASRRAGPGIKGVRFRGRNVHGASGGSAQPLRDTGRLAQSFTDKITGSTVAIGTDNQIARFHQEGTRPYTIVPKNAKLLVFMTAHGPVFVKKVRHPGIPRRALLPSDHLARKLALETVQTIIKRLVEQNRGKT